MANANIVHQQSFPLVTGGRAIAIVWRDGSTSCNCALWVRRVLADGSRECDHTKAVAAEANNASSRTELTTAKVGGVKLATKIRSASPLPPLPVQRQPKQKPVAEVPQSKRFMALDDE